MFDWFLEEHYDPIGSKTKEESGDIYSQSLYLKKHLSDEVGRMLTRSLKFRKDRGTYGLVKKLTGGLEKSDEINVKDIQFAYNNHSVIYILKKRGTAITQCKWDIVAECDKELGELVNNPDNYDKLTRPVCAFITFESDDG